MSLTKVSHYFWMTSRAIWMLDCNWRHLNLGRHRQIKNDLTSEGASSPVLHDISSSRHQRTPVYQLSQDFVHGYKINFATRKSKLATRNSTLHLFCYEVALCRRFDLIVR